MRTFVAIEVPKDLKKRIISIQNKLEGVDIKLVEPENLHFCLKFLGETSEDQIPDIINILDKISAQFEAFDVEIHGMGGFPSNTYIKALWMGTKDGTNELMGLAEAIDLQTSKIGFKEEDRTFKAHLTLGRLRSKKGKEMVSELLNSNLDTSFGVFRATSIKLIKSELSPNGPQYSVVHEAKLC